jgi:radical SAM-linked protein
MAQATQDEKVIEPQTIDLRYCGRVQDYRKVVDKGPAPVEYRYLARFAKEGPMTLLGHLEMVEAFKRSFRRSGFDLAMSQGFHPHPKVSFLTALPLGVTALDECLIFGLKKNVLASEIKSKLNLPQGLRLCSVNALGPQGAKPKALAAHWLVVSQKPVFNKPLLLSSEARLSYTDPKRGPRDFLLSDYILDVSCPDPYRALITIKIGQEGTPKPLEVVKIIWDLDPDFQASLIKLATILDTDPPV